MPAWLVISWALTFGWVPQQTELVQSAQAQLQSGFTATSAEMLLSARVLGHLFIEGGMKSYQYALERGGFAPYRIDYTAQVELRDGPLALGARHECDHPVVSGLDMSYGSMFTEVYVRISF